jgi:small subunit ribosomal protein S13
MAEEQKQFNRPQTAASIQKESADFRYIVRIANTDLDGKRQLIIGLQKIKGISFMMANAYCTILGMDQTRRIGDLSEQEASRLDSLIKSKKPAGVPSWLLNRKKDIETGEDMHLVGADLTFTHENDIRQLKKIKCYRGIRHIQGAPVRGQRTRSNFRKNKGKVASVKRSVVAKAASEAKAKAAKAEAKESKK